jgi:hypothetical protein
MTTRPTLVALALIAFIAAAAPALAEEASALGWGIRAGRFPTLIVFVAFSASIMLFIAAARGGRTLTIRRIAGLNAVDEAIGRSTEMGRKVLFVPGIQSLDEIQTIAALAILKHIAKETAAYATPMEVANRDPLTFAAAREAVKEAYIEAGRPDLFNEEIVTYITYDQFAFTAALSGKMAREKPAVNFFIGSFYAESLLLAEAGQATGAIQISGTAEVAQLPFFVCATDYTLIGEELYAASAYLSREPVMVGSIKGQDIFKLALIIYIVTGILLVSSVGWDGLSAWIRGS